MTKTTKAASDAASSTTSDAPRGASDTPPAPIDIGVETGAAWLPPTDTKKVGALPLFDEPKPADTLWTVEQIRGGLKAVSGGANVVAGARVGATLTMTHAEADAIAVPLTNIINRSPQLRAMSNAPDVVLLGLASLPYGMRVVGEAIETSRKRDEAAGIDIDMETEATS